MNLHRSPLFVCALLAGTVAAREAPSLAEYPIGSTIAIASVLGDEATDLRSGPLQERARTNAHRVSWGLDARIAAIVKSELERNGRFRTVPLALDAAEFTDLPDIGLKPPRSAYLQGKIHGHLEELGPATGAAAYLIIGRATLPNDLDETKYELGGYGLYRLTGLRNVKRLRDPPDYHCFAYARLRLHLIDAKRLRNVANRTIRVSEPVTGIPFKSSFKGLGVVHHSDFSAMIGSALDAALGATLGSMGLDAPPTPTP